MQLYALHCKTNFSFLEGASHADELAERVAELGYAGWAVTDRNSLAGAVRAHTAAAEAGVKLLVGAELEFGDAPSVVVWVTDRQAYGRLCQLLTLGRRRAPKGDCRLTFADFAQWQTGMLAGVLVDPRQPEQPTRRWLQRYRDLLGDRAYLLAELHKGPGDQQRLDWLTACAASSGLPLVAADAVCYHVPQRQPLHDLLAAIRHGVPISQAGRVLRPNAQHALRPPADCRQLFRAHPAALRRQQEIADRCNFQLSELRYEYPEELAPSGQRPFEYLTQLTWEGAARRYPQGVPAKVRQLLIHELTLIEELRYEAYFLTVWDLVRFARQRGILCQGRGSAANSAVCYCLEITSVDPHTTDVLFERFVSKERDEAPDIDVDFEHERREEVLQYLYQKYGRERAGLTAVVITYRTRSAIRDVGKALGLSLDRVDALAKQVEGYAHEPQLAERCRQAGLDPQSELGRRLIYFVKQLVGFPRHLSQHVGGMVITRGPLCELAPIENAAMADRTVIQWDKDDLDALGILKVDCLALGMLTAIHRCFDLIAQHDQRPLTLATVPAEDPEVYEMICQADTMGVFQIESRAQMSMLPRLQPRCYYDLVIEVAIVRPGPIQGQMVHPYLRRRAGEEQVSYPNEAVRDVLHKTLGVPIFQEQAMRLAVVAAGFTPGEADQLRRAMGAWRRPGVIDQFQRKLIEGMQQRGYSTQFAQQLFQQIRGFGEYGFPESHAASFALLVYVSAWLKYHYPAAFTTAVINSQPMGFYAPAQLIRNAREHGVEVLPIDVNHSRWDCTLEPPRQLAAEQLAAEQLAARQRAGAGAGTGSGNGGHSPPRSPWAIRLGFRLLHGFPQEVAERIEAARAAGPFCSVQALGERARLTRRELALLAEADAFQSLGQDRRAALWDALGQADDAQTLPLFAACEPPESAEPTEPTVEFGSLPPLEEVFADYRTTGLSLRGHPVAFCRSQLDSLDVVPAGELDRQEPDRPVCVAGLVLLRQRPSTAKGITFVTLEDETGTSNLVVRQAVWEQYYTVARRSPAWLAHGILQRQGQVIHVVVYRIEDLAQQLHGLAARARDFR